MLDSHTMALLGTYYYCRLDTMGKLLAALRIECVSCEEKSIPLVIKGVYFSGKGTAIQECPLCGHMCKLGDKSLPRSKSSKARRFPYGRFARELVTASRI